MARPARELPPLHRLSPVKPSVRKQLPQPAVVIVGAKQLARHLDLTHPRIHQLADEMHILERLPDGKFNLDVARVAYIRWLRDAERRTAKSKVDSDFVKAKTELIAIRVREKKRELIEFSEAMDMGEKLIGTTLTAMSGMATRVARLVDGNSFLSGRREVDKIVYGLCGCLGIPCRAASADIQLMEAAAPALTSPECHPQNASHSAALLDKRKEAGERCILAVMTDELENSSREYTKETIKALLDRKQKEEGWLVLYLGAGHDAWTQARAMGLHAGNVAAFDRQAIGVSMAAIGARSKRYAM